MLDVDDGERMWLWWWTLQVYLAKTSYDRTENQPRDRGSVGKSPKDSLPRNQLSTWASRHSRERARVFTTILGTGKGWSARGFTSRPNVL
jgi:hypothetical protein